MRMTKRLVLLLATLLIAVPTVVVPAVALGQSAGDDQYVDPFQNNGNGGGNGNGNGGNGNGNSGSQTDNTSASQQTSQTPTTTGDTAAASAQSSTSAGGTLPRTGEDMGGVVLMGVVLLGGGYALRRAWPLPQ
jgi:LPXTG-motif cell wall-anchored protein